MLLMPLMRSNPPFWMVARPFPFWMAATDGKNDIKDGVPACTHHMARPVPFVSIRSVRDLPEHL
jgi:hypothetical protein